MPPLLIITYIMIDCIDVPSDDNVELYADWLLLLAKMRATVA